MHGFTTAREADNAAPAADPTQPLREALAQAEGALRLEQARSRELERQIDTLNRRLVETQEELTFFRKSRDERKP
jgi:molecular chaperone GrpE (heat shock protein)